MLARMTRPAARDSIRAAGTALRSLVKRATVSKERRDGE
jgi:hypothetical protein